MNQTEVTLAMLEKIAASGLDKKDAKHLGFQACTAPPKGLTELPAAGFTLPYYDIKGKNTGFYRYRYLEEPKRRGFDAMVAHKATRYIQPAKAKPRAYFSRLCDWQDLFSRSTSDRPVMITEGELKASCAVKFGLPCIGLGGVWNFKTKEKPLIDDLEHIDWKNVTTYIVYDSDAKSNFQVLMAENALAKELLARGASITIVRLPELAANKKTGLDDFICDKGVDELLTLCENSAPWEPAKILHELNEKVVFVHDPGLVLEFKSLQRMSPLNFKNSIYANINWDEVITTKNSTRTQKKSAAAEWLKWDMRAEVKRTTYAPGKPRVTEEGELNTWPGWGMNGATIAAGDIKLWTELIGFLFQGETQENINWFLQWLAYPLQHPGHKLFSAVLLWSGIHGLGKTLIGYTMERIYGKNFAEIADRDLLGNFNEWAESRQFVLGDEITGGDKRASGDRMKSLITQKFLRVNAKYIPSYVVPDCVNYVFTSNHPDSFFVEDSDRRYFVHEVRAPKPLNESFYKEYDKWYKSDAVGALFFYLLNLDLSGFNPSLHPPNTKSKLDMMELGRSDAGQWVATLRESPETILRMGNQPLPYSLMTTSELFSLYDPSHSGKLSHNGLARELRRAGFRKVFGGENIFTPQGNQRLWAVRNANAIHALTPKSKLTDLYVKERGDIFKSKKEKF